MSKCDLDLEDNVWMEGRDPENNVRGICLLDTIRPDQVIYVLERDEVARCDLLKITSDPELRELAETVPRLPVVENDDRLQNDINRHADSIPFYSVFRGKPPIAQ